MASSQPANSGSRIPNFFRMTIAERIAALRERGLLSEDDVRALATSDHTLRLPVADKMIENVVGVFGLPMGLALNFLVNGRDYVVPLVVEEPSIVAGLSGAGRLARLGGGFHAREHRSDPHRPGADRKRRRSRAGTRPSACASGRHPRTRQQPASENGCQGRRRAGHRSASAQGTRRRPRHGGAASAGGYPRRHGRESGQHHV